MKRCLDCFQYYDESISAICSHCGYNHELIKVDGNVLARGTELDNARYIIGRSLNSGGFGVVYQTWDTKFDIIVAIKEYFPGTLSTRIVGTTEVISLSGRKGEHFLRGKENFIFEARIMMKFEHHENIVNCFNYFEENNTAYIVMEYLEGCSIKEFIAMNSLDLETVQEITLATMNALQSVHEAGFIFRDVAPDNIFLCSDGKIKLIDFGAAIPVGEKIEGMYEDTIIKPGYAPIEQYASDGNMGAFTDIYALGATIYRMISGNVPFESTDRDEYDDLPKLKSINADIPEYIDKAVMKAMAVQPKLRFKSIQEFREAFVNEKEIMYIDDYLKKRKTFRKIIFSAVAVLCLGLTCIVGYIIQRNNEGIKNITVEKDTISVAFPFQKDEDKKKYEDIVIDFNKEYPEIAVDLQMVPSNEYQAYITGAEQIPNVFLNENVISEDKLADMGELLTSLNTGDYFAFKEYEDDMTYKIPLSFETSVCYVNTSLMPEVDEQIRIDQVIEKNKLAYSNKFLLTIKDKKDADAMYKTYRDHLTTKDSFLQEAVPFYVGSTSEFREITQKFAGYWDVKSYENTLSIRFSDYVSIAASDTNNKENASLLFVYQLLSDYSQNRMYVQIKDGELPVNKDTLDFYLNSYKQLSFITSIDTIQTYNTKDIEKNNELLNQ